MLTVMRMCRRRATFGGLYRRAAIRVTSGGSNVIRVTGYIYPENGRHTILGSRAVSLDV